MRWLNIHLRLDNEAEQYCRHVNALVRTMADSIIIFDDNSPMLPHVTLLMGVVAASADVPAESPAWADLGDVLAALVDGLSPTGGILAPHVNESTYGYVLSDLQVNADFKQLRQRVHHACQPVPIATQAPSSSVDAIPHMTLGFLEADYERLAGDLLEIGPGPSFSATAVAVSDVGPKGTCINSLVVVPLPWTTRESRA